MYGYKKSLNLPYDKAIKRTKEESKKEGFGVLTEIDVQQTLKKKLDADFYKYVILGACNPPFAYKSLQAELDIGLMLPCNVIVYEKENKVFVSAILPTVAMSMVKNDKLREIAKQVEKKLRKVIDKI